MNIRVSSVHSYHQKVLIAGSWRTVYMAKKTGAGPHPSEKAIVRPRLPFWPHIMIPYRSTILTIALYVGIVPSLALATFALRSRI